MGWSYIASNKSIAWKRLIEMQHENKANQEIQQTGSEKSKLKSLMPGISKDIQHHTHHSLQELQITVRHKVHMWGSEPGDCRWPL